MNPPYISIIVPIYNEEAILAASLDSLLACLAATPFRSDFEVLLCENGSTDRTAVIADELANRCDRVRVEHLPVASYGGALSHGISTALGQVIVVFNVDFWDVDFMQRALARSRDCDFVIGSKLARGARDQRPLLRRLISRSFNWLLRAAFGYAGTDTHGLKAFSAERVAPIAARCRTSNDLFDSELILRAQRAGLRLCEIPVQVEERRAARVGLLRRVPRTAIDLVAIWWALRR